MNAALQGAALCLAWLGLAAAPVQAAPARYLCDDASAIDVDFTPAQAQLRLGEQQWALDRVRAAGAAQFRNRRQGVSLRVEKSEAVLVMAGTTRRCQLQRRTP